MDALTGEEDADKGVLFVPVSYSAHDGGQIWIGSKSADIGGLDKRMYSRRRLDALWSGFMPVAELPPKIDVMATIADFSEQVKKKSFKKPRLIT